ncbi:hypothetical protein EVAR_13833_1 [Eumeta japonica]|uniref:Uncharacterized protein n=1 Tax=Eumeta variegata TaxID=151549 RepID=A0A4C1U129_EUMVA|nr:hypothetical protein EVAR_13833_1 [Eumeta japonica]
MENGVEMVIRMGSVLISRVRYSLELSVRPGSESTARRIRIEKGIGEDARSAHHCVSNFSELVPMDVRGVIVILLVGAVASSQATFLAGGDCVSTLSSLTIGARVYAA